MVANSLSVRADRSPSFFRRHPYAVAAAATAGALAASALINRQLAKSAERRNPPAGRFLKIDGVWLHYIERGAGEPLLLLHGNGSMIQDFDTSGLIDLAAANHRVIVFDRPGFGHSDRPRDVTWTPALQARLFKCALEQLGIRQTLVLGHSWGASVAIAMALDDPDLVRGLVLASGYYYPTLRADVVALSAPALPVIGDLASNTVSPMLSRLLWPLLMKHMFGPARVPEKFGGFPKEMAVRPSQIRASAEESALMIPDAAEYRERYAELKMPVVIIAGEQDRLVDVDTQSARLHGDIPGSKFHRIAQSGHMIHQTATADVLAAIHEVDARAGAHRTIDGAAPALTQTIPATSPGLRAAE
uniref:Alpha/beta hydrolase fold n=1 Tax=Rhodopseudomonas palustris (strain BisA53) TaxID=316055 RepID=Q07KG3_RHOP5